AISDRPLRLRIPRTSSFPSGHASSATMAALLLADKSRFGPLYGAAAALVATSRIHVRIHHASDIAGGVAVGAVLAGVVKRLAPLR
ncbi:MAG: phosphatase PAP2 family protein, partial [Acidimicrobiales bacterium]|nr:phosphatase PAP2 family protein [Acidimicrobiales bacterium]